MGRGKTVNVPLISQWLSYLLQGWTDTEDTAAWGGAQLESRRAPCSQDLEDLGWKPRPLPDPRERKPKLLGR